MRQKPAVYPASDQAKRFHVYFFCSGIVMLASSSIPAINRFKFPTFILEVTLGHLETGKPHCSPRFHDLRAIIKNE